MKTLKDEIVEALRDAAPYLDEKSEATINKLAAKVESARCENCKSFYNQDHECFYTKTKEDVGCWNFEPKEK